MVHIVPHWNWNLKVGEAVPVFIYTNGDAAELFLNGKSLGMKAKNPTSRNSTERFRIMWDDVPYHPGEIKAIAYKAGVKIGEAVVRTSGEPAEIRLTPDREVISAGGMDLAYIIVEAFDRNGNQCPLADNKINLAVKGEGTIGGVGNGNPRSLDPFQADYVNLFYGKAIVIVKSGLSEGEIELNASTKSIPDRKF